MRAIPRGEVKMFYRAIGIIALILFFAATSIMGESFQIETVHSSVKFKIKCMVLGNVTGEFDHFYGRFDLTHLRQNPPKNP